MKIAICEDEKIYSSFLKNKIENYFSGQGIDSQITVFNDGKQFLQSLSEKNMYDIIFLDIQLGEEDGMEIAASIRENDRKTPVIFVTGLENRAVEGYSVCAYDYIVKSTFEDRIEKVLERFLTEHRQSLILLTSKNNAKVVIPADDILWIESAGRGSVVGTTENRYNTSVTVSRIMSSLPEGIFTEIYMSIFVRTSGIKNIGNDSVEMIDGKVLPMSRRKRKNVMSAVMKEVRGGLSCRAKDMQ